MTSALPVRLRSVTTRVARNPHFWVVLVLSAGLLLIYQAWPWPEWRFASGVWRLFPWLNALESYRHRRGGQVPRLRRAVLDPDHLRFADSVLARGYLRLVPGAHLGAADCSFLVERPGSDQPGATPLARIAGCHRHGGTTVARKREEVLHRARTGAAGLHRETGRDPRGRAQAYRPGTA